MKFKHLAYYICCYIIKLFSFVFYPCKAFGLANLPKNKPFIICPNHISMFDVVALNMVYTKPMHYMAKAELFENKLIGGVLSLFGAFPVKRGKGDVGAIQNAKQMLEFDEPMCIFIEGTRTKNSDASPGRAKSGAVLIASSVGCDIVPVAIVYNNSRPRIFSKTYVYFGTPIGSDELQVSSADRNEIRQATDRIMDEIIKMWKVGTEKCRK